MPGVTGAELIVTVPAAPDDRVLAGDRGRSVGRPGQGADAAVRARPRGSQQIAAAERVVRGELAAGSARRYLAGPVAFQWRGESAGLAGPGRRGAAPANAGTGRKSWSRLSPGLLVLICADVIRPESGLAAEHAAGPAQPGRRDGPHPGPRRLRRTRPDVCGRRGGSRRSGSRRWPGSRMIMAAKGGTVGDVRVGDCLELLTLAAASGSRDMHARSPLFYQLLHARGGWGQDAPAAIQVFSGRGQPSCEQLIDRYGIRCAPMRDVLVDYLRERQPSVDFSSLQRDAYLLGKLFWADLEAHHPGIDSMKLPRDVAAAWKQRVMTKTRTTAAA